MKILDLTEKDWEVIRQIHKRANYEFELPEPSHPLVVIQKKLVDENGRMAMAAVGRLLVNGFLVVDKDWRTPAERLEGIELMEHAMIQAAIELGHDEAIVQVAPRFGKRLQLLGWKPGIGCTYTKVFPDGL